MKLPQIDKFYSKLTPTELGMLTFDAIARKDENEAKLIANNVGWHTYRSVDADYSRRAERLILLASCYSMEHWKTRALMLQACALCYRDEGKNTDDEMDVFGIQCFKRLQSIESALIDVCNEAKIDIESVKSFACIWGFQQISEYADHGLALEYLESFRKILNL